MGGRRNTNAMNAPPRFLTLTLWSALLLSLACVVALDTTEAQLAGVERRGRRRGYGRSAKRALALDPTIACRISKPTKGYYKGIYRPKFTKTMLRDYPWKVDDRNNLMMQRVLERLQGKTTVKRRNGVVVKIREVTLIRKFKGLSKPNRKQDHFLVNGIDYVAKSMSKSPQGCKMLQTLEVLWTTDDHGRLSQLGIGAKYSPVTKMLWVNLKLTKTLTPRACTTSEKRKDCFLESAHQNCWCKKLSSKGSSKFLAAAASFSAAYQRGELENKETKVQIGESDEVQSRRRSRRRSRSRRKGRRKGNSRRRSRTALQKKNAIAQSKCKRSCIRYDVAKKCEASKGRTQGSTQTLDGLMLDTDDGFKTECAIL